MPGARCTGMEHNSPLRHHRADRTVGPPHRHHDVLYNLEQPGSAAELGAVLSRLGEQVSASSSVTLREGTIVELPDHLQLVVRYERTPHGALALRVCAEWDAHPSERGMSGSLAELLT